MSTAGALRITFAIYSPIIVESAVIIWIGFKGHNFELLS
jgi:hypothetical protein